MKNYKSEILEVKTQNPGFLSFIDQEPNGFYSASKLIRFNPQNNQDIYFHLTSTYTNKTTPRSYRRNKTHVSMAIFKTKYGGATKENVKAIRGSFLELDGSTDGTIKTIDQVKAVCMTSKLPPPSNIIQPSHFHLIWSYRDPLPFSEKMESFWTAVQKTLIQIFKNDGFLVDCGASLNMVQNLRNPSQLNPFNYKRQWEVVIDSSHKKTSLRAIYRATQDPSKPLKRFASVKVRASTLLRQYLRSHDTFSTTQLSLAKELGVSINTIQRELGKALVRKDLEVQFEGNNKGLKRISTYKSLLFIEPVNPEFSETPLSTLLNYSLPNKKLLSQFLASGSEKGKRNKTIFALVLYLRSRNKN